jgi:signal transduction histidine kinase
MHPFVHSPSAQERERGAPPHVPSRAGDDLLRRKLGRLRDFVEQALSEADPRLAALGMAEESVLRVLVRLDSMIERVLAESKLDAGGCVEWRPCLAELLRCAALIQRFAHLRLAFSDLLRAEPEPRSGRASLPDHSS